MQNLGKLCVASLFSRSRRWPASTWRRVRILQKEMYVPVNQYLATMWHSILLPMLKYAFFPFRHSIAQVSTSDPWELTATLPHGSTWRHMSPESPTALTSGTSPKKKAVLIGCFHSFAVSGEGAVGAASFPKTTHSILGVKKKLPAASKRAGCQELQL